MEGALHIVGKEELQVIKAKCGRELMLRWDRLH